MKQPSRPSVNEGPVEGRRESIPTSMTAALIAGETKSYDVPHDVEYTMRRCQGYIQMITVCSFLFPIGLQGTI